MVAALAAIPCSCSDAGSGKETGRAAMVLQLVQQGFDHQQKRWERIPGKLTKEWDKP